MDQITLTDKFRKSVATYPDKPALLETDGIMFTYSEANKKVNETSDFLLLLGIKSGDKIAVLSENSPLWGICYLAIVNIGAVVVPILNDFSRNEVMNILEHSGSKAIFVSESLRQKIQDVSSRHLKYIIDIKNLNVQSTARNEIKSIGTADYSDSFKPSPDDLAAIIYTSGTTGSSKGVMLTHRNIISNIEATFQIQKIIPGDRLLSILPLSHAYECTLGFLMPLFNGASIYYLQGPPTASILIPALQKVRPTMILSVPLVIEKIFKGKILPTFQTGLLKLLYRISIFRKLFNWIAGWKLMKTFGGKLHFFGIGGAMLEEQTEKFLREARFPYAIGYGLTEASPLLAGCSPKKTRFRSTGFCLPGQELKLININPETGEGEIVAKGDNVMKGYFENEELTKKSFTESGWFKTGDLGRLDKRNYLYIKGRLKNMILGSNGENIYPEVIEALLNRHNLVLESVVYELKGKLIAKVHLDYTEIEKRFNHFKDTTRHLQQDFQHYIKKNLEEIKQFANSEVSSFSKLAQVIEQAVPFEKTPTQKIKKYLYIY